MTKDSAVWLTIGFIGQAIFTARFVVQWAASEKRRNSVVPIAFWWLSLVGGGVLLAYASYKRDPVIVVGQSLGLVVYVRNLMLVRGARRCSDRLELAVSQGTIRSAEADRSRDKKAA